MQFQIYADERGQWRWNALGGLGHQLMTSSPYPTEAECRAAVENLKKSIEKRRAAARATGRRLSKVSRAPR
jgi:uncharacterized protein YegP (UPF0339 family)